MAGVREGVRGEQAGSKWTKLQVASIVLATLVGHRSTDPPHWSGVKGVEDRGWVRSSSIALHRLNQLTIFVGEALDPP